MFLQFLQDKSLGAVSIFMTGNYPRQPVDDDGPLSLRCWCSQPTQATENKH